MKEIRLNNLISDVQSKYSTIPPKVINDICKFGLRRLVSESFKGNDVLLIRPDFKFKTYTKYKSIGKQIARARYRRGAYERRGKEAIDNEKYYIGLSHKKYEQLVNEGLTDVKLFILLEELKQYLFPKIVKVKYDGKKEGGKWIYRANDLITKHHVEEWIK